MIIGGGKWQVPIVKKAKYLGFEVICSNLFKDSPAFEYADHSYVANVLDKEINLKIAKSHNIDAVITDQSDIAVNTVAYINEKLNLDGINCDIADLYTNKYRMRKELITKGLHHPKYKICENVDDLREFYNLLNSKIIIKPLSNQSSRGVRLIDNIDNLDRDCNFTLSHSSDGKFLAEEYIGGIEITVEGYKYKNGSHHTFAVSKKSYFEGIAGVADALQYQPEFDEFDIEEIKKINNKIFDKVPFAITHVEYKFYNGKFYLIEAAIRGGGTKVSSLLTPIASGYDTNELLIKNATGEIVEYKYIKYTKQYAILKFFGFKSGVVESISGLEKIKEDSNILDIELEFDIGDRLLPPSDDRSRVGYFIAKAVNLNELNKTVAKVYDTLLIKIKED